MHAKSVTTFVVVAAVLAGPVGRYQPLSYKWHQTKATRANPVNTSMPCFHVALMKAYPYQAMQNNADRQAETTDNLFGLRLPIRRQSVADTGKAYYAC